jgi:hypothetical protein
MCLNPVSPKKPFTHIYKYLKIYVHAWMHGWMDGCMHGCMDGWMYVCAYQNINTHVCRNRINDI